MISTFKLSQIFERIFPFLMAAIVALMLPIILQVIERLSSGIFGFSIGYHEIAPIKDYLYGCAYAFAIFFSFMFWPIEEEHRNILMKAWLIRCSITLGIMLFYEGSFTLDAFDYFFNARFPEFRWPVTLGDNWAVTGYITWWINRYLMIEDSFHALKVIFSLAGFWGSYLLYLALKEYYQREMPRVLWLLQLFPSMLFWSSTLGKDPITFLGICLYVYGTVTWMSPNRKGTVIFPLLAMAAGIGITFVIRPWTAQVLILPLILITFLRVQNLFFRLCLFATIPFLFNTFMSRVLGSYGVNNAAELLQATNAVSRSWSRGGSALEVPTFNSFGDILRFAPIGMFTALFRPLPGEIMNPFGLLAGFENLILLFFVITGIKYRTKNWADTSDYEKKVTLWAIFTILGWAFLYAFISYQNLGAAFRFRLQILPVLMLLVICLNKKSRAEY